MITKKAPCANREPDHSGANRSCTSEKVMILCIYSIPSSGEPHKQNVCAAVISIPKKEDKTMARTPKKKKNQLPSGSYRVQVYSHADADGKKHYKSFTAPSKKLAQAAANDWLAKRDAGIETPDDLTVCEAITRYVNVKKGVLSPSTLK